MGQVSVLIVFEADLTAPKVVSVVFRQFYGEVLLANETFESDHRVCRPQMGEVNRVSQIRVDLPLRVVSFDEVEVKEIDQYQDQDRENFQERSYLLEHLVGDLKKLSTVMQT